LARKILSTEGVVKKFGGFTALNGVSLSFNELETTFIIGPNGAGKTTFINVVSGKLRPDKGRVLFNGTDITRYSPHARVRAGINRTFQIPNLFRNLTVRQNLLVAASSREDGDRAADEVLSTLKLSDYVEADVSKLPQGTLRMVELGMVILTQPKVAFLDEPTAGLNPEEKEHMIEVLRELGETETLIIVEHDMDVVFGLSDRVVVMHRGEVLADGTPEEVSKDEAVREVYLG